MMKKRILALLKTVGVVLCAVVVIAAALVAYWYFRPNRAEVSEDLVLETWYAINDGLHNSNTDMIYWSEAFYLIHAAAPWHFASESTRLVLLRSEDARTWEEIASFQNPGEDIRDPKFMPEEDELFIYFLKNINFPAARPYFTLFTKSTDGVTWTPFEETGHDGWLFWRPKTPDNGKTWYVAAYWFEHGESILLKSTDGIEWEIVSQIYEGDFNDETAIEFLPDGRMLVTARLECEGEYWGDPDANTLIATAKPPFTDWDRSHSTVTRLDGPMLFSYNDRVYAIGRYEPRRNTCLMGTGSILNRKRTSLFLVREDGLVYLSDLPSAGDTSYAGIVLDGDDLTACYYTSDVTRDYPWVMGMVLATDIMIAKIDMTSVEALALKALGE